MEFIKKQILQKLTTGITATTGGIKYIIIPNLAVVYHMKISLTQEAQDIGFFDAYPDSSFVSGGETFYALDNFGHIYVDDEGNKFTIY